MAGGAASGSPSPTGEVRAVLTDIEGTTSSIDFVKSVLFPYARKHLRPFLLQHHREPEVAVQIEAVRQMLAAEGGEPVDLEAVIRQLERWTDEDRKITPLKALQGMIWEAGYREGTFRAHVYEDAVRALRCWRKAGLSLYVYSSGSVQAQRLFFRHTTAGDLTSLFSGYFDTTVGAKREAQSYRRITAELGLPPSAIVFLSDVRAELDAARTAGLLTVWVVREGRPEGGAAHPVVRDFGAIAPPLVPLPPCEGEAPA